MKIFWLALLFLAACARAPIENPAEAFRAAPAPEITDSLDIESLRAALDRNLAAFSAPGTNVPDQFAFDGRIIGKEEYRLALEALKPELESFARFHAFVRENFDFYEVYGNEQGWGEVFTTGYFDPVVQGSLKKTARHSRPLYRSPPDLVSIDLTAFAERFPELGKFAADQKTRRPVWRGRYLADSRTVIPYYPREDIERAQPLRGQGLELVWLDPVDAFFLEIQGSGLVELPGGKSLRVGYAGQNGFSYVPIGKFLTDAIPLEQMSLQRIRRHLATLTPEERDTVLFQNPSYVFFQKLEGLSLGFSGAEVTAGRTIATDQFLYPKGTLAFFSIEHPVFADAEALDPVAWEPKPRWVFDQDTGGAIRGGGRVDLYMGQGPVAERMAGVMKRPGRLWVLAPKAEFIEKIRGKP